MELKKSFYYILLILIGNLSKTIEIFAQKGSDKFSYESTDLHAAFQHPESLRNLFISTSEINLDLPFEKFGEFENLEFFSVSIEHRRDVAKVDSILKVISRLPKLVSLEVKTLDKLPNNIRLFKNLKDLSLLFEKKCDCQTIKKLNSELDKLQKISIVFSQNNEIPDCIYNFTSISEISIGSKNPNLSLPDGISKLNHLEFISIGAKCIKQLPKDIGSLKHLKQFWINGGLKTCPISMLNIDSLKSIDLKTDYILNPNCIAKEFVGIKSLKQLKINDDWIKLFENNNYINSSNISGLEVSFSHLTSTFPKEIFKLSKLTELSVWGFSNQSLKGIERSNIKHLQIKHSNLNSIFVDLVQSEKIETFWISYKDLESVSDSIIFKLRNTKIKTIYISVDSILYNTMVFPNTINYFPDGKINTILGDGTQFYDVKWNERTFKLLKSKSDKFNNQIIEKFKKLLPGIIISLNQNPRIIFSNN